MLKSILCFSQPLWIKSVNIKDIYFSHKDDEVQVEKKNAIGMVLAPTSVVGSFVCGQSLRPG